MTLYEFVRSILEKHLKLVEGSWDRLSNACGYSVNTIRYSVENGTARHKTLYNVINRLEGLGKAQEFLIRYENDLNGLEAEITMAKNQKEGFTEATFASLDRSIQTIMMYTGASEGVDYKELVEYLPTRKGLIDHLIAINYLKELKGRVFSDHPTGDLNLSFKIASLKADIISELYEKHNAQSILTLDERVSLDGFVKISEAYNEFIKTVLSVIDSETSKDGVSFSLSVFLSSLGLSQETFDKLKSIKEARNENT